MSLWKLILALISIVLISGGQCADTHRSGNISLIMAATGGEEMDVASTHDLDMQVTDGLVYKDFIAGASGSMICDLALTSSTDYSEYSDDSAFSVSSTIFQSVQLPGYFTVDLSNEHDLLYLGPGSAYSPETLSAEMTISTGEGQRILTIRSTLDEDVDKTIKNALAKINQEWYDKYCAGFADLGFDSKTLKVTLGSSTEYTETEGTATRNWGHANSATKSITFE